MKPRYNTMPIKLSLVFGLCMLMLFACMSVDQQDENATSVADKSFENDVAEQEDESSSIPLAEVLQQYAQPLNKVKIPAKRDTIVTFPRGTQVRFKAGSFVNKHTGKPVTGEVEIRAKEYYDASECILAQVTTNSDKGLLESGGMIYLEAFSNGNKCELTEGASIQLSFTTKESQEEGMALYSGSLDPHGDVVWTKDSGADRVFYSAQTTTATNDSPSRFDNSFVNLVNSQWVASRNIMTDPTCIDCRKYFSTDTLQALRDYLRLGVTRNFKVRMVMDHMGNVDSLYVMNKQYHKSDSVIIAVLSKVKHWVPPTVRSQIDTTFVYSFWFKVGNLTRLYIFNNPIAQSDMKTDEYDTFVTSQQNAIEYFRRNAKREEELARRQREKLQAEIEKKKDEEILASSTGFVDRYIFTSRSLGWINCDRLFNTPVAPVYALTDDYNPVSESVKLVIKDRRAVLAGNWSKGNYYFPRVPFDTEVYLIGIRTKGEQLQFAMHKLNTGKNRTVPLHYETVTYAGLERELKRLD